jgi:hypothetical protein
VIDKNKIRREIQKNRRQLQATFNKNLITGLYFDGRKDQTIIQYEGRRETRTEEHIAIIREPNSEYFGHVALTPPVKAIDISNKIISCLENSEVDFKELKVIGSDGTNVNTGWKGGVIRLIEIRLGKPLQWSVCLLHFNELPLRALLKTLDGQTRGPYTFAGPIGSLLHDCEKAAVVDFEAIETDLPQIDASELSTDQQYLYQICNAIKEGNCTASLAKKNPGKVAHSRWLTTANRLLRLYIATVTPSENFKILVKYVLKVYAKMWFEIRAKPNITNGARHLWQTIVFSNEFPDHVKTIIHKVIQGNGYFGHCENIILSMLTDSRKHIRALAVRRIIKARTNKAKKRKIFYYT